MSVRCIHSKRSLLLGKTTMGQGRGYDQWPGKDNDRAALGTCRSGMMRCGSRGRFLSVIAVTMSSLRIPAIAIAIPVCTWQRNGRRLGSRAVGIQNADTLRMLVATPGYREHIGAIWEGALSPDDQVVYKQLCALLHVVTGNVDTGASIGLGGQDDLNAEQVGNRIAQAS